ncbi:MAG: CoB--CoM heterodisulfide reductase iron-sulfur subunit A family protein, partial [Nitrospirae bacterium]
MAIAPDKTVLVVGGGISGITATLETAEAGTKAVIVEKNPYLGGRVAQLYRYFPKLCPPYCGLELNFRRIKENPSISYYTLAEVEDISGGPGNFRVKVRQKPRFVNEKCTACGACVEACPVERPNDFNFGMDNTKAIYLPHDLAFPMRYVIDGSVCKGKSCAKCVEACKYGAIDLDMKDQSIEIEVGSIVFATGWNPYDATKMDNLAFGKVKNVITNMMMERLSAQNGPTKGRILRPSDGKEAQNVAFVQCAGSRDENHLNYCSAICCMASMKQATYLREKNPD